ncbi:MAG: hypothetical protein L3J67_06780 [Hyphomicrobiaceae bacterium]|nr:hypothetical protein [Hyphomicrobiaceae bacterium]
MKHKLFKAGLCVKTGMLASLWLGLLLGLSACDEIEGVDYLRQGHPADPGASSGKPAKMSRALTPENINVRPQLGGVGSSTPQQQNSPAVTNHRGSH